MSVNKAIVAGNLGRDPEIRALPSGQSVASFSLVTIARFKFSSAASKWSSTLSSSRPSIFVSFLVLLHDRTHRAGTMASN